MFYNNQLTSWPNFLHALQFHFGPSQFDDPQGALFKITQTSIVWEYQTQFESTATRVIGLLPHFSLTCFISELKPHIRREVQALQPISLIQAFELAKIQEDKYIAMWNFQRSTSTYNFSYYAPSAPLTSTQLTQHQSLLKTLSNIPIKSLTASELQERPEKGLCYTCDEIFIPGHKCKTKLFLLVHQDDDSAQSDLQIKIILHIRISHN